MERRQFSWWRLCGVLLVTLALLPGCQSAAKATARSQHFREQLTLAAQAINAGNLATAKGHVSAARSSATGAAEMRKLESLEKLITGAEALMEGDAARARAEWSRIEDPVLNDEVRSKARWIGVTVPITPIASESP